MTEKDILAMAARNREAGVHEITQTVLRCLEFISRPPTPLLNIAAGFNAVMLSNPTFEPAAEKGETRAEACARRACDYAEALLGEVSRRTAQGKAKSE